MQWLGEVWRRLTFFFRRGQFQHELKEEMDDHVRMKAKDLTDEGMLPDQARNAARREFGNTLLLREESRDALGFRWLEALLQDVRYGLRQLRRNPGFTAVAVITLALGIGANSAIFSVVNAVLLKAIPYPHPRQLVEVWRTHGQGWVGSVSIPDLRDWQKQNTAFKGISAYSSGRFNLRSKSAPQTVLGAYVSANFFRVMQVPPLTGRGFVQGEDTLGHNHVAVLGYDLWRTQFGGQPNLVGRSVRLNGDIYMVVGVMPRSFHYPTPTTQIWLPLTPEPAELRRDAHDFLAVGRLRPGISIDYARVQLNGISAQLAKAYPETDDGLGALLIPLKDAKVGRIRGSLLILFGVVGFVFLIACANVSSFVLSRAAARRREIAVRLALGASRMRLGRQFFAESLLLALGGATLAVLTAGWSARAIIALGSHYFSDPGTIRPDEVVLGFTIAIAILSALLLTVAVAMSATQVNLQETIKEGAQTVAGGRSFLRRQRVLVVVQIAAAFPLIIGAGAMVESLQRLSRSNPGFNPDHVLTVEVPLSPVKYNAQHPASSLFRPALEQIEGLPGVKAAAVITYLPMQRVGTNSRFQVEGRPKLPEDDEPWAEVRAISPDYYRVMEIPLIGGRWFADADNASSPEVAIVNRTFVNLYFPNEEVLGKRIEFVDEQHWATIVGVVADSRQAGLGSPALPEVDLPYTQSHWIYLTSSMSLAVRTTGDPLPMARAVEQGIYSVDPDQGVFGVRTMHSIIGETEADERFVMWLLSLFSGLALVLAATGLFGQMSYAVTERTHEIGIRVALGAKRRDVLRLVIAQGAKLAGLGMMIGLGLSFGLMRLVANQLYGIKSAGPWVTTAAAVTLAATALLACYIPARRATKVDPMVALRYE
jgi:predicted permease